MILNCLLVFGLIVSSSPNYFVVSTDPPPLVMPGHVTIGILSELRRSDSNDPKERGCSGPVISWALQEVAALEWALTTINNQSSNDFTIGMKVYDSCGDKDRLMRQASTLLKDNEISNSPLLGIVALGSSPLIESTVSFLHAFAMPLITTHAPSANKITEADNVFTTAPHLYAQIQAALSVISRQRRYAGILEREHRLGVVSGCEQALQILQVQSVKAGIEINSKIQINLSEEDQLPSLPRKTLEFIKSQVGFQGTVIVLLDSTNINNLAHGMFGQLLKRSQTRWIFVVLDGEPAQGELNMTKMNELFPGAVVVEPHSPLLPGLNHHLENAFKGNHSIIAPLLPLLQTNKVSCPPDSLPDAAGVLCSPEKENKKHFLSGARATAAVKAVSSLAAAFRLVQIERCPAEGWCPQALSESLNKDMLDGLMKLSYNPQGSSDKIRYTADGRLVSSFVISRVTSVGLQQVGKYREDTGVVWTHPLPGMRQPSDNEDTENLNNYITPEGDSVKTFSAGKKGRNMAFDYLQIQEYPQEEGIIKEIMMTHQDYISRTWALSVLVIACIGIFAALYIGIYVAVRYCDGTITGPQFLGGILLVGIVCVYASCIVYILPPSAVTCRLRAWLPNMALALCFSVLLVKGMQLRALVSVGLGGEVSQINLYISLVFMMGIEVALTILGHKDILEDKLSTPLVELDGNGMRQCKREKVATLITQDYLLILLVFGIVLGVANRRIHRNHNEGRWLLLVSVVSTPVVLAWSAMSFLAPPCLEPPTTCAACIVIGSSILVMVFFPKMKIISRQAKEFRHKRLSAAPSLSTIFTQLDLPPHPLQPPPPFCDPPQKSSYTPSDVTTLRSSYHGNVATLRSYAGDATTLRSYGGDITPRKPFPGDTTAVRAWRDHLQESPCLHRPPAPPPPPPPIRSSIYYGSSTSCYP